MLLCASPKDSDLSSVRYKFSTVLKSGSPSAKLRRKLAKHAVLAKLKEQWTGNLVEASN